MKIGEFIELCKKKIVSELNSQFENAVYGNKYHEDEIKTISVLKDKDGLIGVFESNDYDDIYIMKMQSDLLTYQEYEMIADNSWIIKMRCDQCG